MLPSLNILIAPLDWGLGHTTRCLPLIKRFLSQGHQVTIAGPKQLSSFIAESFPTVATLDLKGYEISYSKSKRFFSTKIILQIPKILQAIHRENKWLREIQQTKKFDLIISDNRYGLHSSAIHSVIMTHQLAIQTGQGKIADWILGQINYYLLRKFSSCWVVDEKGENNLAGSLSHPTKLPQNARYIGILSQMDLFEDSHEINPAADNIKKNILILLSGPEPLRGLLEAELKRKCTTLETDQYKINFVTGSSKTADNEAGLSSPHEINYYSRTAARELFPLLKKADLVICRSGYSTLMDLAFLNKKALLIPTPGQTEQEYLAKYMHRRFGTVTQFQNEINLKEGITEALLQKPIQIKHGSFIDQDNLVKTLTATTIK